MALELPPSEMPHSITGSCEVSCIFQKDADSHSVTSEASTLISKSKKTLRREQERQKRQMLGGARPEPKTKDAEVQCELLNSDSFQKMQERLARAKLKLVAMKGDLAAARRNSGFSSSSHIDSCVESGSSHSAELEGEDGKDSANSAHEQGGKEDSSLDDNVEVGDVAMITGLESEKGKLLNGRYGKVVNFDATTSRFGVRIRDGTSVAVRKHNLEMGMKQEELSDEDEQLLLSLEPTTEELKSMPFERRIASIYGCTRQPSTDQSSRP